MLACPIHLHSPTVAGRHLVRCCTEFCPSTENFVPVKEVAYGHRVGTKHIPFITSTS